MITQSEAFIYLANHRGCTQDEHHRSLHTFNFEKYSVESRRPPGSLLAFNDETLGGGCKIKYRVAEASTILLLPVVGGLSCGSDRGDDVYVEAGQSFFFSVAKDSEFEISNPYEKDLIGFLQIRFKGDGLFSARVGVFDLDQHKNKLVPLVAGDQNGFIGKFEGRQDFIFQTKRSAQPVFVFVLEGVFEVQNRLLQQRDGLALWNCSEVEWEALSSDAIILLLEL